MGKILCSLVLVLGMCGPAFALDLTSLAVGYMLSGDGKTQAPPTFFALKDQADGFIKVRVGSEGRVYTRMAQPNKEWEFLSFEEHVKHVRPDCDYVGFVYQDGDTFLLIKRR